MLAAVAIPLIHGTAATAAIKPIVFALISLKLLQEVATSKLSQNIFLGNTVPEQSLD
jgi:hypothetical protein